MRITTAHRQVVEHIGTGIIDGTWTTHQAIEPDTLGAKNGISRTVTREAVRVLEDKGLIAAHPGSGTRALPATDWDLLDPDVARWIAASPAHDDLKIQAKEFAEALLMLAPAFGDNPYLTRALAALGHETSEQ